MELVVAGTIRRWRPSWCPNTASYSRNVCGPHIHHGGKKEKVALWCAWDGILCTAAMQGPNAVLCVHGTSEALGCLRRAHSCRVHQGVQFRRALSLQSAPGHAFRRALSPCRAQHLEGDVVDGQDDARAAEPAASVLLLHTHTQCPKRAASPIL
jgi:hypothetical protein